MAFSLALALRNFLVAGQCPASLHTVIPLGASSNASVFVKNRVALPENARFAKFALRPRALKHAEGTVPAIQTLKLQQHRPSSSLKKTRKAKAAPFGASKPCISGKIKQRTSLQCKNRGFAPPNAIPNVESCRFCRVAGMRALALRAGAPYNGGVNNQKRHSFRCALRGRACLAFPRTGAL